MDSKPIISKDEFKIIDAVRLMAQFEIVQNQLNVKTGCSKPIDNAVDINKSFGLPPFCEIGFMLAMYNETLKK